MAIGARPIDARPRRFVSRAQSAIDNAASALQDFEQMDRRARDYIRTGQKLLASDLIFADGLEITGAMRAIDGPGAQR